MNRAHNNIDEGEKAFKLGTDTYMFKLWISTKLSENRMAR